MEVLFSCGDLLCNSGIVSLDTVIVECFMDFSNFTVTIILLVLLTAMLFVRPTVLWNFQQYLQRQSGLR